ncbi:lysophospholipid acyltransferase family protein [Gordonia sp. VNQ95]|uniref:lysophospholipid acyltransferase family protein n=1 Tax=Gordonia sp. VNQ95 TaxID=3156619 RepID=UPI0032B5E39C
MDEQVTPEAPVDGRPARRPRGLGFRAWVTTRIVRRILRMLAMLKIVHVRVSHREVVPRSGPVILASNHISMLDGIFLWGALRRRAIAIAMAELWSWPVAGWLVRKLDFIPVERTSKVSGSTALERLETALRFGGAVIIYPEGRCVPPGEHVRFKPGAAVLAFRTRTPVIPVKIIGSNDVLPLKKFRRNGKAFDRHRQVTLLFGEPLQPDDFATPGDLLRELRWQIDAMGPTPTPG